MKRLLPLLLLLPFLLGLPGDHPIVPPPITAIDCSQVIDVPNDRARHWFPKSMEPTIHYHLIYIRSVCDGALVWRQGLLDIDGKQVLPWSDPSLPFRLAPEPGQWVMLVAGAGLLYVLPKK